MALVASVRGYAPSVAVEFARKLLFSEVRPTFADLEDELKGKPKARLIVAAQTAKRSRRGEAAARSSSSSASRRSRRGHHGGAWKVAYADFVTAMMAFFLVMWLVTAVVEGTARGDLRLLQESQHGAGQEREARAGPDGSGRREHLAHQPARRLDAPKSSLQKTDRDRRHGDDRAGAAHRSEDRRSRRPPKPRSCKKLLEKKQLDALMQDLKEAIDKSQALEPFKDQLLLDITPEGLRIQIVDAQNRPDVRSRQLAPEGLHRRRSCTR